MQQRCFDKCIQAAECMAAKLPQNLCPGFITKYNLQGLKDIMEAKDLHPSDYRYLPYGELRKLAGV